MSFLVGGKSCGLAWLGCLKYNDAQKPSQIFLRKTIGEKDQLEKGDEGKRQLEKGDVKEKNTGYYKGSTGVQR